MNTPHSRRLTAVCLGVLLIAGPISPVVQAQSPPPHYAITNVRVVTGSGQTIESGTIVIRDGLIDALGADVSVPDGAWTLDGTGMTAYPGLIDAKTTLGLPSELRGESGGGRGGFGGGPPAGGGGGDQADHSWGPEDRPATFTWVSAADELETRDSRIESWRSAGFTSAVTVPGRGLFPGQASMINLAGERPNQMVVASPVALGVTFTKGRGFPGYPNSPMGTVAYVKQVFFDARHYDQAWSIYDRHPVGTERPAYDRALEPLRPALSDDWPVLMPADWAREIDRVMAIARDVGVSPVIYGGRQAWRVADRLAAADIPVLVNVDWPQRDPDSDPEAEESLQVLRYRDRAPTTPAALHAAGVRFAFTSGGMDRPADMMKNVRLAIRAGLPADAALHALTMGAAEIFGVGDRLGSIEPGKIANVVLTDGDLFAADTSVNTVIVDGHRFENDDGDDDAQVVEAEAEGDAGGDRGNSDGDGEEEGPYEPVPMVDNRGPVSDEPVILIENATIVTASDAGTIENGSILIRDGRIAALGTAVGNPGNAKVIDATGMWVTPGIIDAHSHIAAESINEGAVAVSAMTGIKDVIHPDQIAIYRGLAGGVTTANVLHGSANPIGGKNGVIKLRWGADSAGLLLAGAPEGIKFALGENTKRDRNPDRYPASRMGVQDVIRQAFLDAQAYRAEGRRYEQALADGEEGLIPPRRDLEMEALVEILEGTRLVHAHSYRADEILQLLRLAEEFGFRIATLQHVLEGYRVADEIAEHGAGASTFSDWWGYKVEAYEAIPHNAALMTERGVVVSINSDSGEEMRHLNQEAAKTMRWGDNTHDEAIRLVTINPAIQLGIDDRVGSIEVGKDADLVIFTDDPLSAYARVEKTILDGKVWFDREHDMQMREAIAAEKAALMEKQKPAEGGGRMRGRPTGGRPEATSTGRQEENR